MVRRGVLGQGYTILTTKAVEPLASVVRPCLTRHLHSAMLRARLAITIQVRDVTGRAIGSLAQGSQKRLCSGWTWAWTGTPNHSQTDYELVGLRFVAWTSKFRRANPVATGVRMPSERVLTDRRRTAHRVPAAARTRPKRRNQPGSVLR